MYLANSSVKDADVAAVGRARLQKCISWLEAIAGWYSCSPPVRPPLFKFFIP